MIQRLHSTSNRTINLWLLPFNVQQMEEETCPRRRMETCTFGKKALTVTRERYTITGDDPESVLKAVEAIARLRDEELSD